MESYLSSLNHKLLYYPLNLDFNRLILARFNGSHYLTQEFYPYNLYQRYKGVFFVKGEECQPEEEEKNESLEEMIQKNIEGIKEQKQVEEIKMRIKS